MYEWARPEISIPVHGEARHLEEHADFAIELGAKRSFAPRNGDLIRIAPDGPERIEEVPAGRIYLDGDVLMPDGAAPMRERRKLSQTGALVVSLVVNKKGDLVSISAEGIGVFYGEDAEAGQDELEDEIEAAVGGLSKSKLQDYEAVSLVVKRAARVYFDDVWGKRPVIMTQVHWIGQ